MAKEDVVQAQVQAVQAGELQALVDGLGACYEAGKLEGVPAVGGLSQSDVDAAVAKALEDAKAVSDKAMEDLKSVDAQALSDAQAKAVSDLVAVQSALDDMTKKEQLEEQAVSALQSSVSAVQSSLDAIKALVLPALVSAPAPVEAVPAESVPVSN